MKDYAPSTLKPNIFQSEGVMLTPQQRHLGKLLYISDGGYQADAIRDCLPPMLRGNPDYSYQEATFRDKMGKIPSQIHQKIFVVKSLPESMLPQIKILPIPY